MKMNATITRKASKPMHELHYIARATFKATGAVLYGVKSINLKTSVESIYHLTVLAGKVRGCHDSATGETCSGWHYRGHCCHSDYVAQLEAARTDVQATTPEHVMIEQLADERFARIESVLLPKCPICGKRYENPDHGCVAPSDEKRAAFEAVVSEVRAIEAGHSDEQLADVLPEMVQQGDVESHVESHVEDSIRSGEFVDPFVGMSEQERRQAYRAAFPNDFYCECA
jgi:hypothetical protein